MNFGRSTADKVERATESWRRDNGKLRDEVRDLKGIIERDRTLFAEVVTNMLNKLRAVDWMVESRGSYEYDDKRYQDEFGEAVQFLRTELEKVAARARDLTSSPTTQEEVARAREGTTRSALEEFLSDPQTTVVDT